ncbi:hypothetical protein HNR16_002771 [Pseudoclavibacter chungangensis]|uniref:hypothetical protein n=1 Tax=Pseudoclavibacter chungangensis TaxID=587635 RepID=UPI0015CB9652|nr:hypothetical protein [Pseudoclavibacter chungangensis]NYJ67983.1 hypothetical protein [Pseudoclavibacter chungangensis]
MIARHEEHTIEASAWNAFLHDAAMLLTVRERLRGEVRERVAGPLEHTARTRPADSLTSRDIESAMSAADRLLAGAPWV